MTVDGDHKMTEESVDVDSKVDVESGRHEREVTPASCPTRRASKDMEIC